MPPPEAATRPKRLIAHGHERVDPYYWMRNREDPEVIAWLKGENAYAEERLAPLKEFREKLFEEITGRLSETRETVPVVRHGYAYSVRYGKGEDYPVYARKPVGAAAEAPDEVLIDGPALAKDHPFFDIGNYDVPPTNDVLAWSQDVVGRRLYEIRFRDLKTGRELGTVIPETDGEMVWANDGRTLFYAKKHPETLREYQIFRHVLGSDPKDDELVYEEADEQFLVFLYRSKSGRYIFFGSFQTLTTEYRYLPADDPAGEPKVFRPRERDHLYFVEHVKGRFVIRSNEDALNFRILAAEETAQGPGAWREVVPARPDVLIAGMEPFDDWLVIRERADALAKLRVRRWDGAEDHVIDFGEEVYTTRLGGGELENPDPASGTLRFGYTSPTTPFTVYEYDMAGHSLTRLRREEVRGGFSSDDYASARLTARARDGVEVPISLYWRRDRRKNGPQPLLLKGYGSYGSSTDPAFNIAELSLLDRGVMIAIAHIRGGQERGRQWYLDGKLLKKKNTFTDFIDCAQHLVTEGYTSPDLLFARGGSAGGLLMGAVMNMAPDLFHGVIAHVPFVDVVTTMLDDSIPLTTFEYDEWGNPNEREYYDYMLGYSPYDQVEA
ncbi:MAG: S9 family peptidase, partial [Alphaproteobacteria bacterium]